MSFFTSNNTVVIATVYPEVEPYLCRYLDSLEAQSSSKFELLIANDGFIDLEKILSRRKFQWNVFEVSKTISENRRDLINKAIEYGYSKIIFSDCDDELSVDRVDILSSLLDKYSVVVNDLDIIDSSDQLIEKNYLSNRFKDRETINVNKLKYGNMMGLTNTAATADALKGCVALQKGAAIAFDWYLWTTVLLNTKEAVFTNKTTTKYRVYPNNVAGLPQAINNENVSKGVEVKHEYYRLISELKDGYDELEGEFQTYCNENNAEYISALQENKINYPLWWEQIMTPSEVGIV